ncbi:hypothetical protein HDU67_008712, partial [Dinochytrium kinnereticum]
MTEKTSASASPATAAETAPSYDGLSPLATPIVSHAILDKRDVALISLTPAAGVGQVERAPVDVVCVVDLSISMDDAATLSSDESSEGNGLTILDLVKHAVRTVVASLGPDDRLGIVSFSDGADIELPLTLMGTVGKDAAKSTLSRMKTTGSTNIWAGIDLSLNVFASHRPRDSRLCSMLLFTDGQPNIRPPGGEPAMLAKRSRMKYDNKLPCTINTFGFGYNLNSLVLHQIARMGNGSFAFIPDAGFVGTVFVDATANILAAMAKKISITLEPINGAEISLSKGGLAIGGHQSITDTTDDVTMLQSFSSLTIGPQSASTTPKLTFEFGSLQAVQTKDLAVYLTKLPSPGQPYLKVTASYQNVRMALDSDSVKTTTVIEVTSSARNVNPSEVAVQFYRLSAVERIRDALGLAERGKNSEAQAGIKELVEKIQKVLPKVANDKRLDKLLVDLEGQVLEALEEKYFVKWGRHYLLSLSGAHLMQQCNNFKDPGVQIYKGPLFEKLRDDLNELFLTLPPPIPTGRTPYYQSSPSGRSSFGSSAPSRPSRSNQQINMSSYYNA